jgi:hypothetical protein
MNIKNYMNNIKWGHAVIILSNYHCQSNQTEVKRVEVKEEISNSRTLLLIIIIKSKVIL